MLDGLAYCIFCRRVFDIVKKIGAFSSDYIRVSVKAEERTYIVRRRSASEGDSNQHREKSSSSFNN